jgi:hypothetical protein
MVARAGWHSHPSWQVELIAETWQLTAAQLAGWRLLSPVALYQ